MARKFTLVATDGTVNDPIDRGKWVSSARCDVTGYRHRWASGTSPDFSGEGKFVPAHSMKAGEGNGGVAPLISHLGTRSKRVVSLTRRPLYFRQKSPQYSMNRKFDGPHNRRGQYLHILCACGRGPRLKRISLMRYGVAHRLESENCAPLRYLAFSQQCWWRMTSLGCDAVSTRSGYWDSEGTVPRNCLTLNMWAASSFETSINIYQSTKRNIL